jgi:hypothetical protein
MNITLWKNRELNFEDAAQKRAQVHPVPSIRLQKNADADFTEALAQARAALRGERELHRRTCGTENMSAGALIENERNTISLRSED